MCRNVKVKLEATCTNKTAEGPISLFLPAMGQRLIMKLTSKLAKLRLSVSKILYMSV